MGQAAADRAPVADLDVTDITRGFAKQRPALRDLRRPFEPALPGGRAEAQGTIFDFEIVQLADAI